MIRLFTGYDAREAIGWHVFCESVLVHCSQPVEVVPITQRLARDLSEGTNAFTRSRFLVPHLCGYQGWAIFADGADMLARADIAELWAYRELGGKDLWCVKHEYQTQHARKYVGTPMEADNVHYYRKNWASLMLIDCGSVSARRLSREYVEEAPILSLLTMAWADGDHAVGALQKEWNWLVGEYGYNGDAKLAHYTLGVPGFDHYRNADFASEWHDYVARVNQGI